MILASRKMLAVLALLGKKTPSILITLPLFGEGFIVYPRIPALTSFQPH